MCTQAGIFEKCVISAFILQVPAVQKVCRKTETWSFWTFPCVLFPRNGNQMGFKEWQIKCEWVLSFLHLYRTSRPQKT